MGCFAHQEVIVITGPVFAPIFLDNSWVYVHRTVGTFPRLVTVPSHYYKVIIGKRKSDLKTLAIGAFLIPNVDTIDKLVNHQYFQFETMIVLHQVIGTYW